MLDLHKTPHRRWNPLLRDWVVVSPQRTQRPWQGHIEKLAAEPTPKYDPNCYLCPGNSRAGGHKNPNYSSTFVFDNDYAALLSDSPAARVNESSLIIAESERGICRVICFSPRHDLTISNMGLDDVTTVVRLWSEQYCELGATDWVRHVQIFENRGEIMGASNPHPHCQLWATETVPNYPATEQSALLEFKKAHGECMLCEYLRLERAHATRLVCQNDFFTVVVPFWALWPFEVLVLANEHVTAMDQFSLDAQKGLADILKRITSRYDNIFAVPFPYSMGFHQRPTDGEEHSEWHFHAHFYPPLLRSATVRKFMVGYEMLGAPQRDITPESAAERLRSAAENPLR
ncbi:MAG: galactose-1-phosphate uridylyltransferase [Acidobacteria bacterium]|nr:MAG: galactose-1-phosphate uridylyltransferase [Acidobacteriota bacterium]